MRDYLKLYLTLVVDQQDMEEAFPEDRDVVLLTHSELYDIIQLAKKEGYHENF